MKKEYFFLKLNSVISDPSNPTFHYYWFEDRTGAFFLLMKSDASDDFNYMVDRGSVVEGDCVYMRVMRFEKLDSGGYQIYDVTALKNHGSVKEAKDIAYNLV